MNARIESLHLIETALWQELARAAGQRSHAWRPMVLATIGSDDPSPRADARIVILREVDVAQRVLRFFTDDRSPKVAQIGAHPQATLVAWSRELGWQLRLRVRLAVHTDGQAVASRWLQLKTTPAARDYLSTVAPGTPVERYLPERASREHFALVEAEVEAIDWLELHVDGHRRALFGAGGGQWLQP